MRLWMALLAVVPACGFESNAPDGGRDSGPIDSDDAPPIPPDAAPVCVGTYLKICFEAGDVPTTPPAVLTGPLVEINTDSLTQCNQKHDQKAEYCVIAGAPFVVPSTMKIRAFGSKPLVLWSTGNIELHGEIDVSSTGTTSDPDNLKKGAGAYPAGQCPAAAVAVRGYSGGYGGSFQGKGGEGQRIDTANTPEAPPATSAMPSELRGGCPGAPGAVLDVPTGGGGGNGGGAVAILATSLHIDGTINASGAGGGGGGGLVATKSGGGGGGSGGMIVLDLPASAITRDGGGSLFANGGGGGEGGAGPLGGGAAPGQPGKTSTRVNEAAAGGVSSAPAKDGGNGGPGSVGDTLGGSNAAGAAQGTEAGGGAGGGGAGFVHAPGITGTGNISPAST